MRIVELFKSIQGETTRAGEVAIFVRLAGCNLNCIWCDTGYARTEGQDLYISEVIAEVHSLGPCRLVCITGGEPMLHNEVPELIERLLKVGYEVQLMTNGSMPLDPVPPAASRIVDIKSPWSHGYTPFYDINIPPPHFLLSNLDILNISDEVKFVVRTRHEFEWASQWALSYGLFERVKSVLVAPVFGELDASMLARWVIDSGLPFRLNLQIHKLIFGPDTRC